MGRMQCLRYYGVNIAAYLSCQTPCCVTCVHTIRGLARCPFVICRTAVKFTGGTSPRPAFLGNYDEQAQRLLGDRSAEKLCKKEN